MLGDTFGMHASKHIRKNRSMDVSVQRGAMSEMPETDMMVVIRLIPAMSLCVLLCRSPESGEAEEGEV